MNKQIRRRVKKLEARRSPGPRPLFQRDGETRQDFWERLCAAPLEVRQLRVGPFKPGTRWCWETFSHVPTPDWTGQ